MASNSNKQLFQAEPVLLANSVTVLKKRYLRKKESGQVETPKDLFIRVAKNIAETQTLILLLIFSILKWLH